MNLTQRIGLTVMLAMAVSNVDSVWTGVAFALGALLFIMPTLKEWMED